MHWERLRWLLACIGLAAIIGGCASTHNLRDGMNVFGGGFIEEDLRPGLYEMSARANTGLWPSYDAAAQTWRLRAESLCGAAGFVDIAISEHSGGKVAETYVWRAGMLPVARYNAVKSGYVLCKTSGMSTEQALTFLNDRLAHTSAEIAAVKQQELQQLGGADCAVPPEPSAERDFKRGRALLGLQDYAGARACFMRVQNDPADPHFAREACYQLGLMFEGGLGVPRDLAAAKIWYAKSGL